MTQSEKVKLVAKILKTRFQCETNKAIAVAYVIVEKLDKPDKVEVKANE